MNRWQLEPLTPAHVADRRRVRYRVPVRPRTTPSEWLALIVGALVMVGFLALVDTLAWTCS